MRATVSNTGEVDGKEVVQLYVGDLESSVRRPVRELKGFRKVALAAGGSATVEFTLCERDLSYWSVRADGWVFEPGEFEVAIGASSRDLRLSTTVEVPGPALALPLDRNSTLAEWLDHPVGHDTLVEALRNGPAGDLTPMLDDPRRLRTLGSFPVSRLASLLGPEGGDELLAALDEVAADRP